MPFRSKAQRSFLFANHPEIAKRWAAHTPKGAKLPKHAKKKHKKKRRKSVREQIHEFMTSGGCGGFQSAIVGGRETSAKTTLQIFLAGLTGKNRKRRSVRERIVEFTYAPSKYGWGGKLPSTGVTNPNLVYGTQRARLKRLGGFLSKAGGIAGGSSPSSPGLMGQMGTLGMWSGSGQSWQGDNAKSPWSGLKIKGKNQTAKAPLFTRMRQHGGA